MNCPCCIHPMDKFYQPKQRRVDGKFVDVGGTYYYTCWSQGCPIEGYTLDSQSLDDAQKIKVYIEERNNGHA